MGSMDAVAAGEGVPDIGGENLLRHLRRLARERSVVVPEFVVPREGHLHTGRLRQHYLDWGNEGAMPVVFLHAGRLNAHSWDLVCLALRDRYRCLALDLPGHGDSERAPGQDYSMASCAEDLRGFADALALQRFCVVGLSQGGKQALAFAGRHAERLSGLVIMDIGPDIHLEGAERQRTSMAVYEPLTSFEDFVRIALADRPSRDPEKLRFTLAQNLRRRADGKWEWKYDVDYRAALPLSAVVAEQPMLAASVPRVTCPVLVVRGERSDILLREQAAALAAGVPNGRWMEIPGARHFLHHDNPNAVIEALAGFLATVSAR